MHGAPKVSDSNRIEKTHELAKTRRDETRRDETGRDKTRRDETREGDLHARFDALKAWGKWRSVVLTIP